MLWKLPWIETINVKIAYLPPKFSDIWQRNKIVFFSTKIDEQNLFQREKNRFQYVALFPTSGLKEHEKATNFSSISMLLKNSLWSRNKKFPRTHKKKKSNSDFTFCLDQTRFLFALKSHSWHEKKSFFHTLAQKIRKFPRKIRTDLLKPALLPVVVLAAASVDFCESSAQLKKKKNKKKRREGEEGECVCWYRMRFFREERTNIAWKRGQRGRRNGAQSGSHRIKKICR